MQSCRKATQNFMTRKNFLLIALLFVLSPQAAIGQQTKSYRIGVLHPGGSQYETLDGLREGLKELGLNVGKQLILDIRDVKGVGSVKAILIDPRTGVLMGGVSPSGDSYVMAW